MATSTRTKRTVSDSKQPKRRRRYCYVRIKTVYICADVQGRRHRFASSYHDSIEEIKEKAKKALKVEIVSVLGEAELMQSRFERNDAPLLNLSPVVR